ncbi:hepcidin-like [Larimichthys crocea]|uniref:hepcidin-like n=1 Tax=Larimichthys crocea TaxID=215358 RepID=UPI000F5E6C4A|nr:hepcidin-like [Larimichthys crocea]
MKTFSVAVAVAVMLAFICLQESSAVPVNEEQELEQQIYFADPEMPVESWKMPYHLRQKRHSSAAKCLFCCRCCPDMIGCGICCRF